MSKQAKTHIFDVSDAVKHGVEIAVLLQNIRYWLEVNAANDNNLHDGEVWTFNSARAYAELFPYMKAEKIQRLLKKMEELGLLISGNYNRSAHDRTKWYSIKGFYESHSANFRNANSNSAECHTYINTNINTNTESTNVDSFAASAPDEVREAYDFYCQSDEEYNAAEAPEALPLPKPTKLTDKRRRELKRALKELPEGRTFAEVVLKIGRCPFLMGENSDGWVIHLDFLIRKGKFQEILDGKYPERPAKDAPGVRGVRGVPGADLFTDV